MNNSDKINTIRVLCADDYNNLYTLDGRLTLDYIILIYTVSRLLLTQARGAVIEWHPHICLSFIAYYLLDLPLDLE